MPFLLDRRINPRNHNIEREKINQTPFKIFIYLNTLTPVSIATTIVANVKYARVSSFITRINNMWWAHATKPNNSIDTIIYTLPNI